MTVDELIKQLENDLLEYKEKVSMFEKEYNYAIDTHSDRGTVTYFFGRYENALRNMSNLHSAFNIINEKLKEDTK